MTVKNGTWEMRDYYLYYSIEYCTMLVCYQKFIENIRDRGSEIRDMRPGKWDIVSDGDNHVWAKPNSKSK